jgi:hypothetical protein
MYNLIETGAGEVVEDQQIDSVLRESGQGILGSQFQDLVLDLLGGDLSFSQAKEVSGKTSNVRSKKQRRDNNIRYTMFQFWPVILNGKLYVRCHGGTRNLVGSMIGTNPDASNIETRSKDINTLAKVGEVGTFISNGGSTNCDSKGTGSWGVVASITVVITSGDSKDNTFLDSLK